MTNSQLLAGFNKTMSSYNNMKQPVCKKYGISKTGFDIIMFLHNNRDIKTADEVCQHTGSKPAMTSLQVEKLSEIGFITKTVDTKDKRRHLLNLTELSKPLIMEGTEVQKNYYEMIFNGVNADEIAVYLVVAQKMTGNMHKNYKSFLNFDQM